MLQNNAAKVYAVDVGYNQLAWSLRQDERVVSMERTNVRYMVFDDIGEPMDFISADVAFISLDKILPVMTALMKEDAKGVVLIKPQFEAGREKVGKKGVVKDPAVWREVIDKILSCAKENRLYPAGLTWSPIRGPEGNVEFLLLLSKEESEEKEVFAEQAVTDASEAFS